MAYKVLLVLVDGMRPDSIHGPAFPKGKKLDSFSILDFAPTIATLLGVEPDEEWEGTSLV